MNQTERDFQSKHSSLFCDSVHAEGKKFFNFNTFKPSQFPLYFYKINFWTDLLKLWGKGGL